MEILVIDDDTTRLDWFLDVLEPAGYNVRTASDSDLALDQLKDTQFDLAFFDHDLGEASTAMLDNRKQPTLPGNPNGSRLLGYAMQNYRYYQLPKHIWVHSANPVVAKNITDKCQSAEIPYVVSDYGNLIKDPEGFLVSVRNFLYND